MKVITYPIIEPRSSSKVYKQYRLDYLWKHIRARRRPQDTRIIIARANYWRKKYEN
jgi:hypothetical protein